MKRTTIVLALLFVAIAGYWLYEGRSAVTPAAPLAPTPQVAAPKTGLTHNIIMDAAGFSPANLAVKAGDTVIFKNADSRTRWPASGLHPTHLLCPGFDSLKPMQSGEEYSHVFAEAEECPMHDHLIPSLKGKITVTP